MDKDLYHKLVFVRFKKYFPNTSEEEINEYFKLNEKEKLFCEYCGIELLPNTKYPYEQAPSLDRKLPESRKGKNEFDNIAITCTQCNIVKGTMLSETYLKMLKLLSVDKEASFRIRDEIFLGRKAYMLERKRNNTPKRLFEYV